MNKPRSYNAASQDLKQELAGAIPREILQDLHRKQPWKHFAVLAWQLALLTGASWVLWARSEWWLWIPVAFVQGFTIFNFTVLLHDVLHECVFAGRTPRLTRFLGLLYAIPSGISATQFTRWHLDHHRELGSSVDDPKRAHLTPKINARWLKALYFTPALFFIYFRAARKENATYPEDLRRTIAWERRVAILFHLTVPALIFWLGTWQQAVRVHLFPVFIVFPVAFAINRLGQHYNIVPADVANWSTRMARSRFWETVFLSSNYHLEHHYFPNVPLYNLRKLNKALEPVFTRHQIRAHGYVELVWKYIILNRAPHTDWESAPH